VNSDAAASLAALDITGVGDRTRADAEDVAGADVHQTGRAAQAECAEHIVYRRGRGVAAPAMAVSRMSSNSLTRVE
jgi:hypothetical protein